MTRHELSIACTALVLSIGACAHSAPVDANAGPGDMDLLSRISSVQLRLRRFATPGRRIVEH